MRKYRQWISAICLILLLGMFTVVSVAGATLSLSVSTTLGGRKGTVTLTGDNLPGLCYVQVNALDAESETVATQNIYLKDGVGYYNLYGKTEDATRLSLTAYADDTYENAICSPYTVTLTAVQMPEVFITEITNSQIPTFVSHDYGKYIQKFQYIELYNTSENTVDLSEYTFVYNDHLGSHEFDWILEDQGSMLLGPGEMYVIGVYSKDSAGEGYTYDTQAGLSAYWSAFNKFYNCNIPVTNRVLIPCVASGDGATKLNGISQLLTSGQTGVTVSAELHKGGRIVTKVSMPDAGIPKTDFGIAYQYLPGENTGVNEKFLFCSGCFPYQLLKDQDPSYCEQPFLNGTPVLKAMSWNVLATNDAGRTVSQRMPLLVQTIQNYQPDVIGMQEYCYLWRDLLHNAGNMPSNYSVVWGVTGNGRNQNNMSTTNLWDILNPIYYRSDKFELLDSGHAYLTENGYQNGGIWDSNETGIRTMTWAVLKNKQTGEVTNVVNAHLILDGKQARTEQVKLLYYKAAQLKNKYGGGVVIMGDHNFLEGTEPYQVYMNSGLVQDSRYLTVNHNGVGTCPAFDARDELYACIIDYIFISPADYAVGKYEVVNGVYPAGTVSDHSGIYVELYNRHYEDTDKLVISGAEEGKSYCDPVTLTVNKEYIQSVTVNGTPTQLTDNTLKCANGNYKVVVTDMAGRTATVNFKVTGHLYQYTGDEGATCIDKGSRVHTCQNCGDILRFPGSAYGTHVPQGEGEIEQPSTCKEKGSMRFHCSICEQDYFQGLPLGDHRWENEYTVDVTATCQQDGSESIHCSVCDISDKTTSRPITDGDHVWGDYTVDQKATCTQKGRKSIYCSLCSAPKANSTVEIPAVGHTGGAWKITVSATYAKEGLKTQYCSACGDVMATQKIAKLKGENVLTVFKDIKASDWFVRNGAIDFAYNMKLFNGTSATAFSPDTAMNRGMFVTVLGRLHGVDTAKISAKTKFADVKSNQYYAKYVKWASDNGIVNGTSATTFSPDANVSREQICAMMVRYCDYAKITLKNVNAPLTFKDAGKISAYAKKAVAACQRGGIVNGKDGGVFDPGGNATRAEVATIMMNFYNNYLK